MKLLGRFFLVVRLVGTPNRVSLGVRSQMYEDGDLAMALPMADNFYRGTSAQRHTREQSTGHSGGGSNTKAAQDVSYGLGQRYSKVENKFSGGDTEDVILSLREYDRCADDFEATTAQRRQLLHNLFHGEVKRFYLDNVDGAQTYSHAKELIVAQYCSKSRQV
jgi:hypothetical protein